LSLAVQSAALIKSAAGDPVFPALFAQSVAAVDEELGQCLLVAHWRGGDAPLESVAFGEADLVVASGSDATIASIAARVPGRFIGHGHKISFAVIGTECLRDPAGAREVARRLAYDVSLWDQQGCLSPQLCYVEAGGRVAPGDFARLLADALSHYAEELPCRALTFDERAAVLRFRQEAEWRHSGMHSEESTDWSLSVEHDAVFVPTCLHRCVRLKVIADCSEVAAAIAPHRRHLEAAGVAAGADRLPALIAMLADCGVHRICPIGRLQEPPLSWPQGGRPRVGDWIEWAAVEV